MWLKSWNLLPRSERFPVITEGVIVCGPEGRKRTCVVANLSTTGAMVILEDAEPLQEEGRLAIPKEECSARFRLAWQHGNRAGVRFLQL